MDVKMFYNYIAEYKKLDAQPKTFKVRWRMRKLNKKINKVIKSLAKEQANLAYNQTVTLYENLIKINLS